MQINISDRGALLLAVVALLVGGVVFAPGAMSSALETLANLIPGVVA